MHRGVGRVQVRTGRPRGALLLLSHPRSNPALFLGAGLQGRRLPEWRVGGNGPTGARWCPASTQYPGSASFHLAHRQGRHLTRLGRAGTQRPPPQQVSPARDAWHLLHLEAPAMQNISEGGPLGQVPTWGWPAGRGRPCPCPQRGGFPHRKPFVCPPAGNPTRLQPRIAHNPSPTHATTWREEPWRLSPRTGALSRPSGRRPAGTGADPAQGLLCPVCSLLL